MGGQGEGGDGGGWENGIGEAWDATEDGRTKDNAADDLGDDSGLSDLGEGVMEETTEDDDDGGLARTQGCQLGRCGLGLRAMGGYLDDEDDDWVLGIIDGGVGALEDAALVGSAEAGGGIGSGH